MNLAPNSYTAWANAVAPAPVCECGHLSEQHADEDASSDGEGGFIGMDPRPCELCTCRDYSEE